MITIPDPPEPLVPEPVPLPPPPPPVCLVPSPPSAFEILGPDLK